MRLVDAYLRQTFPSPGQRLSYIEGRSAPTPIEAPILRRFLPRTSFYRTELKTHEYEYPEVKGLIAATRTDTGTAYSYCLSPVFNEERPEFLALFPGIRATSAGECEKIARAIADLFATITESGHVGAVHGSAPLIKVELWHGEIMWRHVTVTFSASHVIESVRLNPREQ